jgi:hypothetical protein
MVYVELTEKKESSSSEKVLRLLASLVQKYKY